MPEPMRSALGAALSCFILLAAPFPGIPAEAAAETAAAETPRAATSFAPGPEESPAATLLEITDTALVSRAWNLIHPDSLAPSGDYVVLMPPGIRGAPEAATEVLLLRNGTEEGRLERSAWDGLLAQSASGRKGWIASLEGPEKQEVPLLWQAVPWDWASAMARAEWPSGFAYSMGSTIGSVRSAKPQFVREFDFAWDQKLFSHFLLGASLHRSQFGGGLTRVGREVADTAGGRLAPLKTPEFWGDGFWWWTFSAGVPGLRYTLSLANQPLPKYYWLETRAPGAIRTHSGGRFVKQWKGRDMDLEGNLAQSLDARYGPLRYGILFDFDAYRAPVQTMGVDDLPAWFGRWGAGLILASDLFATRAWLDIPDAALILDAPRAWPTTFRVAFLRLEFSYRNQRSFSLGLSVRVHVDNPIMDRPRLGS